jgi:apolipoprotein N-acyltransferase
MRRPTALGILLAIVVALQFGYPVTQVSPVWGVLYMVLYSAMAVFGIVVVRDDGERVWPLIVLGVPFSVLGVASVLAPDSSIIGTSMLVAVAVFMGALMFALLRFVFRRGLAVGAGELVLAAVIVYLLMGGFIGATFGLLEAAQPGSFRDPTTPDASPAWQQLVYFGYITLVTTGYGDVLPVLPWARSAATFASIAGSLYLTIVVARLVGLWSTPAPAPDVREMPRVDR